MASVLKVDALQGVTAAGSILVTGEGNSTTTNLQQGLAKVWLNYIQQTPAVRDSFNVSGVTDTATGKYAPAYTNSMNSALYSATCNSIGYHNHIENASGASSEASMTSGDCDIQGNDSGNTTADSALTCFVAHGDLA
jgi:hypothetical protein